MKERDSERESTDLNTIVHEDDYKIALYYCYTPIPINVKEHIQFQKLLLNIDEPKSDANGNVNVNVNILSITGGRIRVSPEGINGVLSGRHSSLQHYERKVTEELTRVCCQATNASPSPNTNTNTNTNIAVSTIAIDLDVKYCRLRPELPVKSQLFDYWSIKATAEVVSLYEKPAKPVNENIQSKRQRKTRARNRRKVEMNKRNPTEGTASDIPQNDTSESTTQRPQSPAGTNTHTAQVTPAIEKQYQPAPHLSSQEWHESLLAHASASRSQSDNTTHHNNTSNINTSNAILIDARNIYESNIGHFQIPNVPTILTNTRKYSTLPQTLEDSIPHLAGKDVYMYCTGGVRCERASVHLQKLMGDASVWKGRETCRIYQLEGGIQRYLERYGTAPPAANGSEQPEEVVAEPEADSQNDEKASVTKPDTHATELALNQTLPHNNTISKPQCLFRGKNFVFDPRRTDPMLGMANSTSVSASAGTNTNNTNQTHTVGSCILCQTPHDDYDNGCAPVLDNVARCVKCRILVLVCPQCRPTVRSWGECENNADGTSTLQPDLFCGENGRACVDDVLAATGNDLATRLSSIQII